MTISGPTALVIAPQHHVRPTESGKSSFACRYCQSPVLIPSFHAAPYPIPILNARCFFLLLVVFDLASQLQGETFGFDDFASRFDFLNVAHIHVPKFDQTQPQTYSWIPGKAHNAGSSRA